jgi:hypothetical protein
MRSRELTLTVSVLAPKLQAQLEKQGCRLAPPDPGGHRQRDLDAIVRLGVRGLLSDTEKHRALKRLTRRLANEVEEWP